MEAQSAHLWPGAEQDSSDFDLACRTSSYAEVVTAYRTSLLILGDEPLRTRVVQGEGDTYIVRWRYCPSEIHALTVAASLADAWDIEESTEILWNTGDIVIFDAAGQFSARSSLSFKVPAGRIAVRTYEFTPDVDTGFLVHALGPAT